MKKPGTVLATWQEAIKRGTQKCANCGLTENLTIDHIIPVYILEPLYLDISKDRYDMIYNDPDNFQILCKYCNERKAHKLDIRNPKTIPLLKRLIQDLEKYAL